MKTKIKQLSLLIFLWSAFAIYADAQTADYQALLAQTQSTLATEQSNLDIWQQQLNDVNLNPAKISDVQNEISESQQRIGALQGRINELQTFILRAASQQQPGAPAEITSGRSEPAHQPK